MLIGTCRLTATASWGGRAYDEGQSPHLWALSDSQTSKMERSQQLGRSDATGESRWLMPSLLLKSLMLGGMNPGEVAPAPSRKGLGQRHQLGACVWPTPSPFQHHPPQDQAPPGSAEDAARVRRHCSPSGMTHQDRDWGGPVKRLHRGIPPRPVTPHLSHQELRVNSR